MQIELYNLSKERSLKHIRTYQGGAVIGGMALVVASAITGCSQEQEVQNKKIYVEQLSSGKYVVTEEIPTQGPTEAFITQKDGTIRRMSEAELKALAEQEYSRVQDGSSETMHANNGEGMGLAGTILATAAGVLLGNAIANSLMGNKNFRQNKQAATSRARSFNRSASSPSKKSSKSGFFSKKGKSSTGGRGFFGG